VASLRDRRNRQDNYYRRAKREGFAARSVYKLEELDRRFHLFRPGQYVLDLGCRPGSWLQYAAARVGPGGVVVGLDREPLDSPSPDNVRVLVGDVLNMPADEIRGALPRPGCFHAVLSDMAPDTTGIPFTDQVRSVELFVRALQLGLELGCSPGGRFVGKIFMGQGFQQALQQVRQSFARTKTVKPDASRKASSELYVVGTERR